MEVFQRVEQKYVLKEEDYQKLFSKIKNHIEKDYYFQSTICNIYFDTSQNELIINSLEKPMFKEKVRLRSYNIPKEEDKVFLELKGKYKGVVFKRRVEVTLKDFYKYMENGKMPKSSNCQIMKEIDYYIKKNSLRPKIFLAYDRESYFDKENQDFRITFDKNLRSREEDLRLEEGDAGKLFSKENLYIMEIKSLASIPMWFAKILSELKIYPQSFSKYGNIYKQSKEELSCLTV